MEECDRVERCRRQRGRGADKGLCGFRRKDKIRSSTPSLPCQLVAVAEGDGEDDDNKRVLQRHLPAVHQAAGSARRSARARQGMAGHRGRYPIHELDVVRGAGSEEDPRSSRVRKHVP